MSAEAYASDWNLDSMATYIYPAIRFALALGVIWFASAASK